MDCYIDTDVEASKLLPCPYDATNFVGRITFGFGLPLMRIGAERSLKASDVPPIRSQDLAETVVQRVSDAWNVEVRQRPSSPRLWQALYVAFRGQIWSSAFWCLLETVFRVVQPVLLQQFLTAIHGNLTSTLYIMAGLLVISSFMQAVVHHQLYYITMTTGWSMRIAMTGVIHQKLLKLQSSTLQGDSAADCYNLVANDVQRFDTFLPFAHFAWSSVLDLISVSVLLVVFAGLTPTILGIAIVFIFVAIMSQFGKRFAEQRKITANITDERLKATSEVFSAVMSVKVYGWEEAFVQRISGMRKREHASIFRRQLMVAMSCTMYFTLLPIASLLLFVAFIAQGQKLTMSMVYTSLSLLLVLRTSFGKSFARVVQFGPECNTSVGRFRNFLLLPEVETKPLQQLQSTGGTEAPTVLEVQDASFSWPVPDTSDAVFPVALQGPLNFDVKQGELMIVSGPVGSGKSALLLAMLGELHSRAGNVISRGKTAYAPQTPWISAGTLRSNILAGAPYDGTWYHEVVAACGLQEDVAQLGPLGHETEIGERGVNLSGGQRARVGLARAVYSKADLVLLDDPLAAVDPAVASKLVHNCICGNVLKSAAVVLCTHHDNVLPLGSKVLIIGDEGDSRAFGTPAEVAKSCSFNLAEPIAPPPPTPKEACSEVDGSKEPPAAAVETASALVKAEDQKDGSVAWPTYKLFARTMGYGWTVLFLSMFILSQLSLLVSNYWVSVWANAEDQDDSMYLVVFVIITGITVFFASVRSVLFYYTTLKASSSLHHSALTHVLGTRLGFFTENPHGRVLNRFSGDIGNVDELLSQCLHEVLDLGCIGASTLALVCIAVPPFIAALFGMFWYMLRLRSFVVKSMTQLKRLDSTSRSPVFDIFTASTRGIVCIRAFRSEDAAQLRMINALGSNAQAWYWWLITNRFLGFRLDMLSAVIMAFAAFGGAALRFTIDPGLIGLAIVYVIQLSGLFQFMVRQSALVESYMTSFERLHTYAALPSEPDAHSHQPDATFPDNGAIVVKDLHMRYRSDLPTVLKGVEFSCPGGVKVGLCGRTGSGKSSIFMALSRLADITQGSITIDGVDVASIPLRTLRQIISWVPQEPNFFSGSLRFNLDPFKRYGDDELVNALREVQMFDSIGPDGLETQVADQGSNFSVGERQLLSLSRALLQKRRILCMDEAFANVDFATDQKVQAAITAATKLTGATVLVIAHRMQTLADSDYIVVMDDGSVAEHGSREQLLASRGAFAQMVSQAQGANSEDVCPVNSKVSLYSL